MDVDPTIRVIALGLSEDDETGIVACAEPGWSDTTCGAIRSRI
jgi:hypothetical protein